jgi:hypothetical protein
MVTYGQASCNLVGGFFCGNGSEELNEVVASFEKAALMNAVLADGNIELKVAGKLKSGQYFYGRDTVRIIH